MEPQALAKGCEIQMLAGLPGLQDAQKFVLESRPGDAPFLWLRLAQDPERGWVVISPSDCVTDYHPEIPDDEALMLGLKDSRDAVVLNIVTVHPNGRATVNLRGPIVINHQARIAKQVIPRNATRFAVEHPLATSAT
jgi:flagellar assembly factor FliW